MSQECWENCPRIGGILRLASEVTEYMPPGQTTDNIWARHGNEIESLSRNCPGPTQVSTETVETKLPFHMIRSVIGLTATQQHEVTVYDCAMRPVTGYTVE